MVTCEDFYLRRDLRTVYYIQGKPVQPQPVQVRWGKDAADSPAAQMLLLSLANQLARFCRSVGFSGPNAPLLVPAPLGGASLHEALLTACQRIDPCGQWIAGEVAQAAYRIGVGQACQNADVYLGANGWLAYVVSKGSELPHLESANNFIGAGMAACIGAANAFKASLGLQQPHFSGAFSLWSFGRDSNALQGPAIEPTDLGDVLIVGAGAVAAALVYWLRFLPISGHWDVVDGDEVQLDNTNRGLLFTAEDAGWPEQTCRKKVNILARHLDQSQPHICWFDEFDTRGRQWDLILPLANERNVRGFVQARRPPLMIHATTSPNWQTQLHRHRPGRDRCLACRLPDADMPPPACAAVPLDLPIPGVDRQPDAALPFLSAAAGLLIAADLVHLGLGGYEVLNGNLITLDWFSDLGRPTVRHEACQPDCSGWGSPTTRRILNRTSHWYFVDQDASSLNT